jgi:membrane protein
MRLARFIKDVAQEFVQDRGTLFAAAISYYGLVSLIPLLLLGIAVLTRVMGSYADARQAVEGFLVSVLPFGSDVVDQNLEMLNQQANLLGGLGILGLLWIGTQVFVTVQDVMNIAMGAQQRVSFLRARLTALITLIAAGIFLVLSLGISSLMTALHSMKHPIDLDGLQFVVSLAGVLLPIMLSMISFTIAYRFLPTKRIGNKGPVMGGVIAGILFELAKHGFSWYVSHVSRARYLYGSLGGVIGIVAWIYLAAIIVVLGAEVASVFYRWQVEHRASGG